MNTKRKAADTTKYDIVVEENARIAVPQHSGRVVSSAMPVFYNPVMKANRDITILLMGAAAKLYGIKKWKVADVMAASGIRGIRMILDLRNIESLSMNDYSTAAVAAIKKNLKLNKIKLGKKVVVANTEANLFLLNSKGFNYIDIDPFGYPGIFLDAAVKKIANNGIVAVTATDTSALAGTAVAAGQRKYLATPLKNAFMHETGIRMLIRLVQLFGAVHEKAMTPIFSYYKDHYIRAFFLCKKGAHRVDELLGMHKEIYYCTGCCNKGIVQGKSTRCDNCGKETQVAGPIWTGGLFDRNLANKILADARNIDEKTKAFLAVVTQEATAEAETGIGFYAVENICERKKVARQPKTTEVIKQLRKEGYVASPTHCTTTGVKTGAPVKRVERAVMGKAL